LVPVVKVEHELEVIERKMPRKRIGMERNEIIWGWKMHIEEVYILISTPG
jgi:hypothetical protein